MGRFLRALGMIAGNIVVTVGLLGAVELYYRLALPPQAQQLGAAGEWAFRSYVMFATAPGHYGGIVNEFTGEAINAKIATNTLGFNDPHEFDLAKPYEKAANERVILLAGNSAGWGFGNTTTDRTIAGRMQYYLNINHQHSINYTVINLSMNSWIAYQEFIGLRLWGEAFDPDWIIAMDGINDAMVGCRDLQGVDNPMNFAAMNDYFDRYMMSQLHPAVYRGWFENMLIKYSVAYRDLTGRGYVPDTRQSDDNSIDETGARGAVIPTKPGDSRRILDFYLKAEKDILGTFPPAKYIMSTQPIVNQFNGDFGDIYAAAPGSDARRQAVAAREAVLEQNLAAQNDSCSDKSYQPSNTYVWVAGAIGLERLVETERSLGRHVEYQNIGALFPDARENRKPYFVDSGAHLSDLGADVIGKFYAERILAADAEQ